MKELGNMTEQCPYAVLKATSVDAGVEKEDNIMGIMGPVFQIAAIAIGSELVSKLMEESGHGGKVVFVKVISYVGCSFIALKYWWEGVQFVAHMFGVHI